MKLSTLGERQMKIRVLGEYGEKKTKKQSRATVPLKGL
jgi:hypothetical protein